MADHLDNSAGGEEMEIENTVGAVLPQMGGERMETDDGQSVNESSAGNAESGNPEGTSQQSNSLNTGDAETENENAESHEAANLSVAGETRPSIIPPIDGSTHDVTGHYPDPPLAPGNSASELISGSEEEVLVTEDPRPSTSRGSAGTSKATKEDVDDQFDDDADDSSDNEGSSSDEKHHLMELFMENLITEDKSRRALKRAIKKNPDFLSALLDSSGSSSEDEIDLSLPIPFKSMEALKKKNLVPQQPPVKRRKTQKEPEQPNPPNPQNVATNANHDSDKSEEEQSNVGGESGPTNEGDEAQ